MQAFLVSVAPVTVNNGPCTEADELGLWILWFSCTRNSNNPLGFKFSWSARGVLLALRNSATFYKDGKIVHVDGSDLMSYTNPYRINEFTEKKLVSYPNRDSTVFKELYKIPEAKTIVRGNLRFEGFTEFIKVLVDIGLLNDDKTEVFSRPIALNEALTEYLGSKSSSEADLIENISSKTFFADEVAKEKIIDGLKWFGLLSDKDIVPKEESERYLVLLQHKFGIKNLDGTKEVRPFTMIYYGAPTGSGYSAMAKLVGTTAAVASQLILGDKLPVRKGLIAPYSPEINDPIIEILKKEYQIELIEKVL